MNGRGSDGCSDVLYHVGESSLAPGSAGLPQSVRRRYSQRKPPEPQNTLDPGLARCRRVLRERGRAEGRNAAALEPYVDAGSVSNVGLPVTGSAVVESGDGARGHDSADVVAVVDLLALFVAPLVVGIPFYTNG